MPFRTVLFLFLVAALGLSCAKRDESSPRNVIFILVDTLRADHLGVYGYGRATSPATDALAREAVLFTGARSQASCTFPSANSMLTSRYPSAFLGQPKESELGIPASIPSLAEILRDRGWRTAAVSASPVVRASPSRYNPTGGFGRGFEVFHEDCSMKAAGCVNRAALPLLAAADERPLFLYLHYYDPHGPYDPPKAHARRFLVPDPESQPEKLFIRRGDANPIGEFLYSGGPDPRVTPADVQHLVDLYDEEIAYFDGQLAELVKALREGGWLENSIVVFASDHGEDFLEHGHIKHCRTLYDASVKTPLFFRIPGVEPRAVAPPVQNLDIVPTLLDYLGVDTAGLAFEGGTLRPLIEGSPQPDPHQYGMQGTLRSAADGRHKLIHDLGRGTFALYDLRADPGETRDTLRADRRTFHRLRGNLTAWLGRTEGQGKAEESLEAERRLRTLGYIE